MNTCALLESYVFGDVGFQWINQNSYSQVLLSASLLLRVVNSYHTVWTEHVFNGVPSLADKDQGTTVDT